MTDTSQHPITTTDIFTSSAKDKAQLQFQHHKQKSHLDKTRLFPVQYLINHQLNQERHVFLRLQWATGWHIYTTATNSQLTSSEFQYQSMQPIQTATRFISRQLQVTQAAPSATHGHRQSQGLQDYCNLCGRWLIR